ncbi:MAG TPA: 3-isopropylmalate dehydratase small subunit, partial [Candidatus Angelobacter sp.]|nr:3-isopropylmalate dehydratase small subunit [Candidatus Angelobacter sp.]
VIAPSFADIFANNSAKNGLLTVLLREEEVGDLLGRAADIDNYQLTVDLDRQKVTDQQNFSANFQVDAFVRHCLLEGLDDIDLTLEHQSEIAAYEARHRLAGSARAVFTS